METDLAVFADRIAALRADLESVVERVGSGHRAQLESLRKKLDSCVCSLPQQREPESYFDLLIARESANVVRFVSEYPRHQKWYHYLSPEDTGTLFELDNSLSKELACVTDCISIGIVPNRATSIFLNPYILHKAERHLTVEHTHAEAALRATRSTLRRIRAAKVPAVHAAGHAPPHAPQTNAPVWVDIFSHAPHVRHLELVTVPVPTCERMLSAAGGLLESLALDSYCSSRPHLRHVQAHATNLRCFSVYLRTLDWDGLVMVLSAKLQSITMRSANSHLFEEFDGVAQGVETTTVSNRRLLTSLRIHCTELTTIRLESPVATEEFMELLESCGPRLLYAKAEMDFARPARCAAVAIACPNATFESSGFMSPRTVRALSFRVRSLCMGDAPMNYPHITGAGIGIPTTADFCSRLADLRSLELIRMRDTAAAVLESVLSLSNPALDHLVVALMTEPPFDVLDALRNAGTQLLSLIIDSYELPMRGLPEFIAGQRRLEKIVARTEFSKENRGLLPEFVASCAGIVNLRQLRVSPMALGYSRPSSLDRVVTSAEVALMRNSCMPLRARDVTVNIFGVDYLS